MFSGPGNSRVSLIRTILCWPLFCVASVFIIFDLILYSLVRYFVYLYETFIVHSNTVTDLLLQLRNSKSYSNWSFVANLLDSHLANNKWKLSPTNHYYDENLISAFNLNLSSLLLKADSINSSKRDSTLDLMKILKSAVRPNVGNIENEHLYSHSFVGTKLPIEEYYHQLIKSLEFVADSNVITNAEKVSFYKSLRDVYGKSALCLSGGASMGYYHIGVAKALFENGLLPKIFTGTSAGSLIGALICCRTDEELISQVFTPSVYKLLDACGTPFSFENLKRFYTTGALFDNEIWFQKLMKQITNGPTTFLEAFKKTGRMLNISIVTHEKFPATKVLNYISSPDVIIASAVLASSAIPGILSPATLYIKRNNQIIPYFDLGKAFRDGSLKTDIPTTNSTYHIVSQTNPHILFFFYERLGSPGLPVPHRQGKGWRGGFISSFLIQHLKLDLQKWITLLRDLSLFPTFQQTDFSDVFTQNYSGNVTITPDVGWIDYSRVMTDPDYEGMKKYIDGGQNRCFHKLFMIGLRGRVEDCIERCIERFEGSDVVSSLPEKAKLSSKKKSKKKKRCIVHDEMSDDEQGWTVIRPSRSASALY